jgi:ankyrin repeat protein
LLQQLFASMRISQPAAVGYAQSSRHWLAVFGDDERLMLHCTTPVIAGFVLAVASYASAHAQTPPSSRELAAYKALHSAAARGSVADIRALLASGADPNLRDKAGRSPLHVAAFGSHYDALRALVAGGGDINALENGRYDVITIAAVKDDVQMVKLAIELGGNPRAITSRYDGTALIAAAHLGHETVVQALIESGAPLDHVNNLGWTALIETVVLGNGGARHVATARALVAAGASKTIGDRNGVTPLQHAQRRNYHAMVAILK